MSVVGRVRTPNWRFLAPQVYRGLSVNRALLHRQVRDNVVVKGNVLDAGGGHRQSYLAYMNVDDAESIVALDIRPGGSVSIRGSVTQMPIKAETIDTVLCFNLLEHIYDHRAAVCELHRVMKPGAVLYGWTPFALGVHGDPYDYWRYTPDALQKLLHDVGLSGIEIEACGDVFLSAYDLVRPYVRGWIFGGLARASGLVLALLVTRLFVLAGRVLSMRTNPSSCPNGVWFMATRN